VLGPKKTKWSVAFLLTLLLLINVGIFFSRPARAQFGGVVSDPGLYAILRGEDIEKKTTGGIAGSIVIGALNTMQYFLNKIAYDAATYLASGGEGQGALIYEKGFGDYITGVLANTAGDAIGELGKPFGLNLCQFPNLDFQVFLQIGLRNLYELGPPQPNCGWQQLKDGWNPDKFAAKYGGDVGKYIGEKFSNSLSVKNSDFGVSLGALA
jgi:hypothetical protein